MRHGRKRNKKRPKENFKKVNRITKEVSSKFVIQIYLLRLYVRGNGFAIKFTVL